jgi:serine/threonine protein kinase/parvulin-like peptidyl-prolyl isomerase
VEGQQIGSYKIERVLGQGGFGVVYVGVDVRLNRRAAIKQLLPELTSNREIVERFFNEAKAAAGINHLGIVEIYDVGWHTDGSAYFAMKLLDGDSLAKRIRASGPMPIPTAATICRQVAAALAAAHKAGIVHRDLKPDNVVLVPDEETAIGERAIVLDFGIAKLAGDAPLSHKTRTGMLMGTPVYMSPEQCRGAGEVDHRTDIYALGCILFELLAGRPPFEGEGAGEILGKHQYVEPPAIRSLRDDVPPDLAALISKALAKKPEDRQQQMTELGSALSAFTAGSRSAQQAVQPTPQPQPAQSVEMMRPVTPAIEPLSTYRGSSGEVATPVAAPQGKSKVALIAAAAAAVVAVVVIVVVASGSSNPSNPEQPKQPPADATVLAEVPPDAAPLPAPEDPESKDILARTRTSDPVYCKHVLIAWAELEKAYRGRLDPRAAKRTQLDAGKLAVEVLGKLRAKPSSIDELIKAHGEDPGAMSGTPYKLTEKSAFVPEFKKLGMRLAENEAGIVKTLYGYHVMLRIPPPPLDPIESADLLARAKKTELAEVQHVVIGWKDTGASRDPRAKARDKAAADRLAKEILAKVRAGEDMTKLMKEYSEDPGSKDAGRPYSVTEEEQLVEGFKALSLRLDVGEAGIVKTEFGFHIIKRVPSDPIQSLDILARTTVAPKAKVKYILLGYTDAHVTDPRGEKRTRTELEKLVSETLARIKSGTAFESLMKQLSEDKQTGETGGSLDSTTAGLPGGLKMLGTRLEKNEVGVIKTQFGILIVKRVE